MSECSDIARELWEAYNEGNMHDTLDIEIPSEYLELCEHWHSGQTDLLYAISSAGNLTLGSRRPLGCDTDQKWQLQLFRELSSDIGYAVRRAVGHTDYATLVGFEEWTDKKIAWLEAAYGLQEWDNLAEYFD